MTYLLFIPYCTILLHFVTCYHIYGGQDELISPSGNNFNNIFGFGNSRQDDGYDGDVSKHKAPSRTFRQTDFIFDEDNDFNDVVVPNAPSSNEGPFFPEIPTRQPFNGWTTTPSPFITSTIKIPGMGTTRSACEDACRATSQFDPVCGDNGVTYTNIYWFRCAQRCGRNVNINHYGSCPRVG